MNTIYFFAHVYHQKTRSCDFFINLLRKRYNVTVAYVDPESPIDLALLEQTNSETVVLWQVDFLAPYFIADNRKVIVCPMYDASGWLPESHFYFANRANYINFSYSLHVRCAAAGANSLFVKYFPEQSNNNIDWTSLRCFFWRRRPEFGIDVDLVRSLVRKQLSHIHIHDVPDTDVSPLNQDAVCALFGSETTVTFSSWLPNRSDLTKILDQSNIYLAPRPAEGIGMGFLEAMSRGMAVIAHDQPTHSEYLANGINGYLFRPGQWVDLSKARTVGAWARRTVQVGHRKWNEDCNRILSFIEEAKPSGLPSISSLKTFSKSAMESQRRGPQFHENFLATRANKLAITAFEKVEGQSIAADRTLIEHLWQDVGTLGYAARRPSISPQELVFVGDAYSNQVDYSHIYIKLKHIPGKLHLGTDIGFHIFLYRDIPGVLLRPLEGGYRLIDGPVDNIQKEEGGNLIRIFLPPDSNELRLQFRGWQVGWIDNLNDAFCAVLARLELIDGGTVPTVEHEGYPARSWLSVSAQACRSIRDARQSMQESGIGYPRNFPRTVRAGVSSIMRRLKL